MIGFNTYPSLHRMPPNSRHKYYLLKPLQYVSKPLGTFTIPEGWTTDCERVSDLFHEYHYEMRKSRKQADKLWLELESKLGNRTLRTLVKYAMKRLFGWLAYLGG